MPRFLVPGLLVAALAVLATPAAAQTATTPPTPAPDTIRVNTPENRARALFNEGSAALSAGDHEAALAKFEEGLRLDPRSISNLFGKGAALEQMGSTDDAMDVYGRVVALSAELGEDTYGPRARARMSVSSLQNTLAAVQAEQQLTRATAEGAEPVFAAVTDAATLGNAAFRYQYARVLNALGRHADAVAHARVAAETTEIADKSAYYIELGLAERGAGNVEGARAAFEQAREGSWGAWAEHYLRELDAAGTDGTGTDGAASDTTTTGDGN